jgi:cytoskeletal protein CcmA (bactofilin family)
MWSPSRPTSNPPQPSVQKPGTAPMHGGALPIAGNTPYNEPSTYIGKSLLIMGEVSGSEPIHIEGRVEGVISLPGSHISIGRDGMVLSTVQAGEVVVRGTLRGKLTASDRVEIHSGGSLIGDVAAARISIEDGAYFQGSIDMRRPDPKAHLEINSNKVSAEKRPSAADEPQQLQVLSPS